MNLNALVSALNTPNIVVSGERFAYLTNQTVWLSLSDLTSDQLAAYDAEIVQQQANGVRAERDRLLAASDWTQVSDAPVDQAAWATYRQALCDVPQQAGFPENVIWPEEPK